MSAMPPIPANAARSYYTKLLDLADVSDGSRPELAQANAYLGQMN